MVNWGGNKMGGGRANRLYRAKRWTSTQTLILSVLLMLTIVLLMLLALVPSDHQSTPLEHHIHMDLNIIEKGGLGKRGQAWSEVISWQPRVFIYHNFLSTEECQHLIDRARPHMTKSTILDDDGVGVESSYRTSSGAFFAVNEDKVIANIEDRIAEYTFIPVDHGEGLQVLHYEVGQKYGPHNDFFENDAVAKSQGQRVATFLMYLSDVEEGGETVFPAAVRNFSSNPASWRVSECAKTGLSVKPKMGDALLFWNLKPDGTKDLSSVHGGCPVIRGNKWSSTKWMHVAPYQRFE